MRKDLSGKLFPIKKLPSPVEKPFCETSTFHAKIVGLFWVYGYQALLNGLLFVAFFFFFPVLELARPQIGLFWFLTLVLLKAIYGKNCLFIQCF